MNNIWEDEDGNTDLTPEELHIIRTLGDLSFVPGFSDMIREAINNGVDFPNINREMLLEFISDLAVREYINGTIDIIISAKNRLSLLRLEEEG